MERVLNGAYSNLTRRGLPQTEETRAVFNAYFLHAIKEGYHLGTSDGIVRSNMVNIDVVVGGSTERYHELPEILESRFQDELAKTQKRITTVEYLSKTQDALLSITQDFENTYRDLVEAGLPEIDETRATLMVNFYMALDGIYDLGCKDGIDEYGYVIGTTIEGASAKRAGIFHTLMHEEIDLAFEILKKSQEK